MRTLFVSPFAPYRDGIATYALQELRGLRSAGDQVDVLSPLPSAAKFHLPLGGPKAMARLVSKAAGYERTVIQFGPEMLFGGCRNAADRMAVWAGLLALAGRTHLDLRLHEIEYGPLERNPAERRIARQVLKKAGRVTTHTEAERDRLDKILGEGLAIELVDHGQHFVPAIVRSQDEARNRLGLAHDRFVFLSIGFLQHHKGFDLAIDAIEALQLRGAELHIVGSARVDHPDITDYVSLLERRCRAVDAATLHNRYVNDQEFDLWLQAADAVVLPYREIWSSGVVERARLFATPVLAADLPQLRDQAPPETAFFSDVEGLTIAMAKRCAAEGFSGGDGQIGGEAETAVSDSVGPPWSVDEDRPDRQAIESQVVARARAARLSTDDGVGAHRTGAALDRLAALPELHRPQPVSARPGVSFMKRAIDRATAWRIEPITRQLAEIQRATTQAVLEVHQQQRTDDSLMGIPEDGPAGRKEQR